MTDGIDLSGIISALGDGGGDLASKLSSALGDGGGDLASKLSSALKAGGAPEDSGSSSAGKSASPSSGGVDLPSVVAALTRGGDERSAQRRALLSAIRPFVSDRRKRAIDALVGIERLTAVLPGVK